MGPGVEAFPVIHVFRSQAAHWRECPGLCRKKAYLTSVTLTPHTKYGVNHDLGIHSGALQADANHATLAVIFLLHIATLSAGQGAGGGERFVTGRARR